MVIEIITLIGVLVAIIGVPWYLRGRFAKLEMRVGRVELKLNELIRSSNTLNNLSGTLIHLLHNKGIMDDDDFKTILGSYTKALDVQEISPNPLSPEELDRLNSYIRKAKSGEFFSADEVQNIIHDLKGDTEIIGVFYENLNRLFRGLTQGGSRLCSHAEKGSGFMSNPLEILLVGLLQIEGTEGLI